MKNQNPYIDIPTGNIPVQAVAWWLEYDNNTVDPDRTEEREYTAWALESNSNNSIGGSGGGCGDLPGAECISGLKSLFTDADRPPVGDFLAKFFDMSPERVNCPSVFWGSGPSQLHPSLFATNSLPMDLASKLDVPNRGLSFSFLFAPGKNER